MKNKELLPRNEEITQGFLLLVDTYISDLLGKRIEKQLSTSDFADSLHIASRHLSNTLKLTLNTSPCEIIENRVIEEVKTLLIETDLSIADISHQFAYRDTTNFIKFFKGITGVTPLQFRKRQKNTTNPM
ncbi:helix-turn-helix domain-containing protein [Chryseobacterium sp. JV274]|uniref:helix-turn-helix domain-containing protein n=1 Tax=Chryseobacterium sp. JV274 TaxID=1932669 RepID=UPI000646D1C6|nr:AraC family transcriptional regulator [Chryseobacterium sp. JV274]CAD0218235.1 AraC family transcriptional regulator [Chryseobacterium sp. JV274]